MADRWYVVGVHGGCWDIAVERLTAQAYRLFAPDGEDGKPLYSGYLFVRFDVGVDVWQPINGTRGVFGLLPYGFERPSPLPHGFIERLCEDMILGALTPKRAAEVALSFGLGELLKIESGPFAGHYGAYQKRKKGLLELEVPLLGRAVPVKVAAHQVTRCSAEDARRITKTRSPQFGRRPFRERRLGAAAS